MPSRPASERGGSAAAFDGLVDDEPDAEPDTDEADDRGSMLAMFCVSLFVRIETANGHRADPSRH
jgi:hypothetical protein